MDVFRRLGDWRCLKLRFPFGPKKCREKPSLLNKYDYYVYKFQSIVIWEHPSQTVSCLLLIQLLFWMIVNLCWKFYGILFTLLLICCTHDVWTEKIWPEIRLPQTDASPYQQDFSSNSRFLTTGQIEEYFDNLLLHAKMTLIRFRNLRSSHPMLFCAIFTTYLTLLATIGCTISGIWLLYMIVMTVFLAPGIYIYLLPEYTKTSLKQYFYEYVNKPKVSTNVTVYVDEDDEYVPERAAEKLEEAYASVFQSDDTSNDFLSIDKDDLPNIDSLPSFDDNLDEFDGRMDDFDRLSDGAKMNLELSETSSTTSDVSSSERMKFQSEHFDGETAGGQMDDTTSDEEMETAFLPDPQYRRRAPDSSALSVFVSRLPFPDFNQMSKNLRVLASVVPSYSQQSQPSTAPVSKDSNTDDEFEFIERSELN